MNSVLKNVNTLILVLLSSLIGLTREIKAENGHEVGDHGDPVMMMFSKARFDAAQILLDLNLDQLSEANRRDFHVEVEWLKTHRAAMNLDILTSEHIWTLQENASSSCARTNVPENQRAIYLSLPLCRSSLATSGLGEAEAIRMLLHESSHHFGLYERNPEEEELARRIGVAAYKIWLEQRERREPFWSEIPSARESGLDVSPRIAHGAALTTAVKDSKWKSSLYIFGGCTEQQLPGRPGCKTLLGDGAKYEFDTQDPRSGLWQALPSNGAPSPRRNHQLTATDNPSELLLTGGCLDVGTSCSAPAEDAFILNDNGWHRLPNMPTPRARHSAVWAENRLILFGGLHNQTGRPDGAVLTRTETNTGNVSYSWQPLSPGVNFEGRFDHKTIWTGKSLIIWGGCGALRLGTCGKPLMDGFIYTPNFADRTKDQWIYIPAPGGLADRESPSVVWTGRYLLVWGGRSGTNVFSDGALIDLETIDTNWEPLPSLLPRGETGRFLHQGIWDGSRQRMLIIGGRHSTTLNPGSFSSTILSLNFKGLGQPWTWSSIQLPNAPIPQVEDSLFGVYDLALSWGGFTADGFLSGRGYVFFP